MLSVSNNQLESLDERYVEFISRTSSIFQTYPQLEALRHFIFKELLVKREEAGRTDQLKHWMRPIVRRGRTQLCPEPTDVLIVIESQREVIAEALLHTPVFYPVIPVPYSQLFQAHLQSLGRFGCCHRLS